MTILIFILAFMVAITVHEAAHAWTADRLGDPTSRLLGRLTLNPVAHLDIYGTVIIPLLLIFIGSPFVFGWAKPVPIDPYNLANPKKDSALISLAGPLANIILALIFAIFLRFGFSNELTLAIIRFNVVLAVFNLIPISPLDGEKVLIGLLPNRQARQMDLFMQRYGMILLFIIIFPLINGVSIVSVIISPIIRFILSLFTLQVGTI